jgi:uncharacterized protein (DUF58 family)
MGLTRSGWSLLVVGVVVLVVARTVQVPQIWMIGASLVLAVAAAAIVVAVRPTTLGVTRTVAPAELTVGTDATSTLTVAVMGRRTSPRSILKVGVHQWRLPSLRSGTTHQLTAELTTTSRGITTLEPVEVHRHDLLGLASRTVVATPGHEVVIGPQRADIHMGQPGTGALGALLSHRARQFGLGEFEGLRQYVEGDDLRLVHWKASARSNDLLVKQFSVQGATRCLVVLDTTTPSPADQFEMHVSIAASVLYAAHEAQMRARLVTTGGAEVGGYASLEPHRRLLATVAQDEEFQLPVRDPSDGLGVMICVTPHLASQAWQQRDLYIDPLIVAIAVTSRASTGANASSGVLSVASLEDFATTWNLFVGLPTSPAGAS